MTRNGEVRRVACELLVKAGSQAEAESIVRGRLNDWFVDERDLVPATAGFPVGSLLHFTVTPASGHRAVAV